MQNEPKDEFVLLYDFAIEDELIAQMQKVSLDSSSSFGLSPDPLVGSEEWWDEIESDRRPVHWVEGVIDAVWWGSMGDYPEFSIRADDGNVSTWTRQGSSRRYVGGIRARVGYVEHRWKDVRESERLGFEPEDKLVLQVWIEDVPLRSSSIAPGPGGAGYRLAGEHGDVVHYLGFSSHDDAVRAISTLESDGTAQSRPYRGGLSGPWFVEVWDANTSAVEDRRRELAAVAERFGGRYDGGEIVEGPVWGSDGLRAD